MLSPTTTADRSPADPVVVLGAGGAGLMCALTAARGGRRVIVLDHAAKAGGKLIISGGGRCNFTNREVSAKNYVSDNPHFARSALSRFRPEDFLAMVEQHNIPFHERKHGQLFCDHSAQQIIDMLVSECHDAGVDLRLRHEILGVTQEAGGFVVKTNQGELVASAVVVATGGLSYPRFCASGIGLEVARQFGHSIVTCAPALDGFVFSPEDTTSFGGFAGIALDAELTCNKVVFRENLLFTHSGLSGPVALQASLHWRDGDVVLINLLPSMTRASLLAWLTTLRGGRAELKNQLGLHLPKRLAERLCDLCLPPSFDLGNLPRRDLERLAAAIQSWRCVPARTVGYAKAEVTRGGVDTTELSSKTMESRLIAGLYFIGEVVDVTGWLGGFNYQWAWASGYASGIALR